MRKWLRRISRVVISGCAILTGFDIIGHPASIVGNSMYPALRGEDSRWYKRDFVWLSRWSLHACSPGTILTFISPRDPSAVHIKRVVATEGSGVIPQLRAEVTIVPKGHYWMEGDNPQARNDSNVYGPVSKGLVRGRATHIIWPPSRWQRL
ncbi:unnamed protein product [Caenorhabditis auriculariae]|uniref:Mitochondrial inner membrane protease subunit 2 n=1 Tax=Caenorhabditis auriculariae TaxID=2777116 RepID=A0A8S1HMF3_9PELO|nr:unnamed protein product [Caenorhabditis auriculariae]